MKIFYFIAVAFWLISPIAQAQQTNREACDPYDVKVTTTPAPPQNSATYKRHETLKSAVSHSPYTILIGDSLIEGWPANLTPNSYNFGVGGDRTQHVLWRIANAPLQQISPAKVILLIGTNNLSTGDPVCAIAAGISAITRKLKDLWPSAEIAIIGVPPRGERFAFRDSDRRLLNNKISSLAREAGAKLVIVDEALSCGFQEPCENYVSDLLHLSFSGYATLARAMQFH